MQRETRERIQMMIGESKVGAGRAIKLCRELGISPKEFGDIVSAGKKTQEVDEEIEKGRWHYVVTSIYGRAISYETKKSYDKRRRDEKKQAEREQRAREAKAKGDMRGNRPRRTLIRNLDDK